MLVEIYYICTIYDILYCNKLADVVGITYNSLDNVYSTLYG